MQARFTRQPQQPAKIDWSNPITKGLISAIDGRTGRDLLAPNLPTDTTGPAAGSSGIGRAFVASTYALYPFKRSLIADKFSYFLLLDFDGAVGTPNNFIFGDVEAAGTGYNAGLYSNGPNFLFFVKTGGTPTNVSSVTLSVNNFKGLTLAGTYDGATMSQFVNGVLEGSAAKSGNVDSTPFSLNINRWNSGNTAHQGKAYLGLAWNRALSAAENASLKANPWQIFQPAQRRLLFDTPAGGTDTPINPAAGALSLTGYSPAIAQSVNQAFTPAAGSLTLTGYAPSVAQSSATAVNPGAGSLVLTGYAPTITQPQSVAPGAGSLSITGFAPSVTQGITTTIAPGAGSLAFTGYAPSVAQSANQSIAPAPGTLAITGYAPTLAQTANQAILPAVSSLSIAGYAPTVAQALASPNLTPGAGVLSIIGYAPSVVQAAPVIKIGGDDVPREDDERIEIWEPRKPQPKRDDSLDKVVREAYAKATGKPIAAAVAKPGPSVRAPDPEPFDYEEDDFEVLLLSY